MGKPPDLVAAEYVLGSVNVERVPWYAADWLAAGHDGTALSELAGLDGTDTRLIGELLPDAPVVTAPKPSHTTQPPSPRWACVFRPQRMQRTPGWPRWRNG
ncbi:hypothetical protein [Micromonospora sp. NPDC092111]|uniref:hypothetical protein n=1 Tax=Micromonospora sp. NPDC092111 TaxID=3364289 RepID=UPI00382357CA